MYGAKKQKKGKKTTMKRGKKKNQAYNDCSPKGQIGM